MFDAILVELADEIVIAAPVIELQIAELGPQSVTEGDTCLERGHNIHQIAPRFLYGH